MGKSYYKSSVTGVVAQYDDLFAQYFPGLVLTTVNDQGTAYPDTFDTDVATRINNASSKTALALAAKYSGGSGTTDYNALTNKPTIPSTKADFGLGNVDNTSDALKPISTAAQIALDAKASFVKGLSTDSAAGTANLTAINAAIVAASVDGGGGLVLLPKGRFPIAGVLYVTNGILLRGSGNSGSGGYGGTELYFSAASNGVVVSGKATDSSTGYGGGIEDLEINGTSTTNAPLRVLRATDVMIKNVDVHHGLFDNIVIEHAQNSTFLNMTSNYSGRDGLVLDKSCGGLAFLRVNVSSPGAHAVTIQQSETPENGEYPYPTHIKFDTCVFERPTTDSTLINISKAQFTHFHNCMFSPSGNVQTSASPVVDIAFGPHIDIDECYFAGVNTANQAAIRSSSSSNRIITNGEIRLVNMAYFADSSAGVWIINGSVNLGTGAFATSATNQDNAFRKLSQAQIQVTRPNSTGIAVVGASSAEAGQRFRMLVDGSIRWGDGSNFTFPTVLQRNSDGKVGITGGLTVDSTLAHSGTLFGVRGSTPVVAPAISASTAGNPALKSLLTALASQGLVTSTASDATVINSQTGNYTLTLSDAYGYVDVNAATAVTVTVPTNATVAFPVGAMIDLRQSGVGQMTIVGASGVTINGAGTALTARARYSVLRLRYLGSDTWSLAGDFSVTTTAAGFDSTFLDASAGTSNGTSTAATIPSNAFTQIILDTEAADTGSNYDPATGYYTVPTTGKYLVNVRVRLVDIAPGAASIGTNFGVGVGISNVDGPYFQWATIPSPAVNPGRVMFAYQRLVTFTAGNTVRLYAYSAGVTAALNTAQMSIIRVS